MFNKLLLILCVAQFSFLAYLKADESYWDAGMSRGFYGEIIDEFLNLLLEAMKPSGVIEARFGRIEIEAKK